MAELELDDMQALLARGHGNLPFARFVLVEFGATSAARRWAAAIAGRVTSARVRTTQTAIHVAFSAEGLRKLGLPETAVASTSSEFQEGMTTPHRQRVLGDVGDSAPEAWRWGGPDTAPIDAILLLYADSAATLETLVAAEISALRAADANSHTQLQTAELTDREPFGFRDGISQPLIPGFGKTGEDSNTVRAGEFVLGYENEYGLLTDSPMVRAEDDPGKVLPEGGAGLRDFGRNGSYLVVRQLEQDVAGFWQCLEGLGRDTDGTPNPEERTRLAAKMVGRWPDGAPLSLSPERDDPEFSQANDFGYHALDEFGMKCPAGAHVRRANPRDSLEPDPGTSRSYELNKRHRLLRRGRGYGPALNIEDALAGRDGDVERGIHFACLAGNLARQFEFVQHTWLNNPKFGDGYDEVDPIAGTRGDGGGRFKIPAAPVRQRLSGLPSFVTVRGGGYFFLPGIRALKYLGARA